MKTLSHLRIIALFLSVLVISLPICFADEFNLIYDANGNLVTGDSFYREYNELNQLVRVREGNLSTDDILQEFIWHPIEEKILKKIGFESGTINQQIYYINENYIVIKNSSGTYNETYVYQNGQIVAQVDTNGNKEYLHPDHLGSTSLITDSVGNVLENTWYSPFGEIVSGGQNSRFSYEGKEFDEKTKDTDFHFRKYRPEWGRFTQPDTLISNVYDPQSLNRYAFERNNPLKNIDEDGHLIGLIYTILEGAIDIVSTAISIGDYISDRSVENRNALIFDAVDLISGPFSNPGPSGYMYKKYKELTVVKDSVGRAKDFTDAVDDAILDPLEEKEKESNTKGLKKIKKNENDLNQNQNNLMEKVIQFIERLKSYASRGNSHWSNVEYDPETDTWKKKEPKPKPKPKPTPTPNPCVGQ